MADISFDEWRRRQLVKAPAAGGRQTAITPTPAYAPGRDLAVRGGSAAGDAPPPFIDDIDEANWYSPFQPIAPFGPPAIRAPREWDYPIGYNLQYVQPRIELMTMLRGLRSSWGVLATIIETRKDQLLRIPWTIQRKDKPRASTKFVDEMRQFFRRPDRKLSYSQWSRKLLDDLLVIDAPAIYFPRNALGRPMAAEVLDGATVFPLIDDSGRRPDSTIRLSDEGLVYLERQPAFQQIIKGLPLVDLDETQLMYVPMRPRTDFPLFGYPPTEQILIEASEAVRKTVYQLNFWAEGTIPDLIVSVPDVWTPRQIAAFQAHFDAMLSGNLNLKSKVRFLPGGMKPFDVKNASGESLWSQRDETLIRLACYAYSVSPTPFVKQTNRSTAQNAQQTAEEEGLYPLMSYWKDDIMDPIIQEKFGYDDIEFVFQPRPEPDQEKAAKIHDMKIKNGEISRNEARAEDGLEPIAGGDVYTIQVGNAVIPLEMAAAGHALPALGGDGKGADAPAQGAKSGPSPAPSATPLRGPARPTHASPSPVHKVLGALLQKATPAELAAAIAEAKGHLPDYSQVQLKNGNYPKGHVWIQGLNVSIENAPGSKRGEKDESGVKWEVTMPSAYGYVRGTIGADGEALDVYIGSAPDARTVWVIDQNKVSRKGKVKGFDEHKAMICYDDLEVALFDYLASHFDGHDHDRLGDVVELSMKDFKRWLRNGDLKAPIAPQAGTLVLHSGALAKALDTISTATNLASREAPRKRKRRRRAGPRWLELLAEAS